MEDRNHASSDITEGGPYEVVCIGFGPSTLSMAIALHEQPRPLRVLVLERYASFSWKTQNLGLDNSHMHSSLMHDLVAMRNPRSKFTFINFLWATGTLVQYTNLPSISPPKEIFAQYLFWCADQICELGWVRFGQEASSIEPVREDGRLIKLWRITSRNRETGQTMVTLARKVIVATGQQPKLPPCLTGVCLNEKLVHSSAFTTILPQLQKWSGPPLQIAIVGGNTEAVKIFERCRSLLNIGNITMFVKDAALRQLDDNAFVRNLVTELTKLPFELRTKYGMRLSKAEHDETVEQEVLARFYEKQYAQLVKVPDPRNHRFQVRMSQEVIGARNVQASEQITLQLCNTLTGARESSAAFDFVLAASGYEHGMHGGLTQGLRNVSDSLDGQITVDNDYAVNFKRKTVACGSGVWLLDYLEVGQEDVFSFLAMRTQRVVESLLSECEKCKVEGTGLESEDPKELSML